MNDSSNQPVKINVNPDDVDILIVEDNEINRALLTAALELYGFEIECAEDGEGAIQWALGKVFTLIFMDVQLPGISGIEAMQKIKELYTQPVVIVAMTALSEKNDEENLLQQGFDAYIAKPYNILDIMTKLKELLENPNGTKK
ncbi:MAG: response regulator [bacterium]|nr:response regulator [bacterium]